MKTLLIGGRGYIGSALAITIPGQVDIVDLGWFFDVPKQCRGAGEVRDFRDIPGLELWKYENVILVAGHSSVASCADADGSSFRNNVRNFDELIRKLRPDQKFIYASSASVYGNFTGSGGYVSRLAGEDAILGEPAAEYDRQKREIDRLAFDAGLEFYGLRFGTVCGIGGKVFRSDLMLNAMADNARKIGSVDVHFPDTRRAVLWIRDLCLAVNAIIESPKPKPGIYNLGSHNATAGELGKIAGQVFDVPIRTFYAGEGAGKLRSSNYNFFLAWDKFRRAFDWEPTGSAVDICLDVWDNWRPGLIASKRDQIREYK